MKNMWLTRERGGINDIGLPREMRRYKKHVVN